MYGANKETGQGEVTTAAVVTVVTVVCMGPTKRTTAVVVLFSGQRELTTVAVVTVVTVVCILWLRKTTPAAVVLFSDQRES